MSGVTYELSVQWGDTDAAGIVYYPNYYKWMDQATHNFFKSIEFATSRLMKEEQIGLPLLETRCNFFQPLVFEDPFIISTTVIEIRDKVFQLSHRFYKESELVAEGSEVRAWTSFEGNKPKAVSIPGVVREKMVIA
ncbi:acyl-CoA thioesterase [Sporosarcina newyorkensis]|uniref:Acyl-CoA thioester hydrolase n=1 Tax=Sporosarcina newyorkensis TaxID=759851 RepID=A0A1T4Y9S2_9BACL|nr:thioesterase family protein [Sporosarcina newyorkensis]SKA98041.1 acyl-CoA thioester hydrolase [Sporosarcina newyorkensis]